MSNAGLIFIPDISGFTRFVNETEIEHSRFIIEELLETIINSNQIGLQISEIEGDAILFYKFGDPPTLPELVKQVEHMFREFHKQIKNYEYRRLCQCSACRNAIDLTLKVIIHYGEFSSYKVKEFSKLLGKDIIVAHQLLKNDIDTHEYMLLTDRIHSRDKLRDLPSWVNWSVGTKVTDSGEVPFNYSLLTPLKETIVHDPVPALEPENKTKMVSASRDFDIDIIGLLAVIGRTAERPAWQVGVKEVKQISDRIPQLGTRHQCVMDKGSMIVHYSKFSFDADKIIVSETEESGQGSTYYTFDKITGEKTKLTMDYYLPRNPVQQLLFNLTRKRRTIERFQQSLTNLKEYIRHRRLPY